MLCSYTQFNFDSVGLKVDGRYNRNRTKSDDNFAKITCKNETRRTTSRDELCCHNDDNLDEFEAVLKLWC